MADKLVAIHLHDGTEHWVLVHIEIQAQRDDAFARRVHALNNRNPFALVTLAHLYTHAPRTMPPAPMPPSGGSRSYC